mmetsp:Transcript_70540/g.181834  ORF Transcript_70540/g.181834 Transcript_70540/m.181834 type:complete len:219 (+) Transcript_70540:281-937(+)
MHQAHDEHERQHAGAEEGEAILGAQPVLHQGRAPGHDGQVGYGAHINVGLEYVHPSFWKPSRRPRLWLPAVKQPEEVHLELHKQVHDEQHRGEGIDDRGERCHEEMHGQVVGCVQHVPWILLVELQLTGGRHGLRQRRRPEVAGQQVFAVLSPSAAAATAHAKVAPPHAPSPLLGPERQIVQEVPRKVVGQEGVEAAHAHETAEARHEPLQQAVQEHL